MKSIIILLVLSLLCLTAYSKDNVKQKEAEIQSGADLVDTIYIYSIINNDSRYSYNYDSRGKLIYALNEQLQNGLWLIDYQYTYHYDLIGNLTSEFKEHWENGRWNYEMNSTYEYDTLGNKLSRLNEIMVNGIQVNYSRFTYIYENNGDMISSIWEDWKNGQWLNYLRVTITYDTNNNKHTEIQYHWQDGSWINFSRTTTDYDNENRIITEIFDSLDFGGWKAKYRKTYNYNYKGKLDTVLIDDLGKINKDRYTFAYDSNGNISTIFHDKLLDGKWTKNDNVIRFQDSRGLDFTAFWGYKIEIKYKGLNSVKEETNTSSFSLNCSPNPTAGQIKINYTLSEPEQISITITNTLGIELARIKYNQMQDAGSYNFNYDAGELAAGAYFLSIKAGNKTETKKFVIVR